jgi:hypothetical protein
LNQESCGSRRASLKVLPSICFSISFFLFQESQGRPDPDDWCVCTLSLLGRIFFVSSFQLFAKQHDTQGTTHGVVHDLAGCVMRCLKGPEVHPIVTTMYLVYVSASGHLATMALLVFVLCRFCFFLFCFCFPPRSPALTLWVRPPLLRIVYSTFCSAWTLENQLTSLWNGSRHLVPLSCHDA